MGIIARCIKYAAEKLVTLTGETVKDFNINTFLYTPAGDDSIPLPNERLLLIKVDGTGKYVSAGVLTSSQGARPGEKIFFARNGNGEIVGKLSFLNDGTVILMATNDHSENISGDCTINVDGNYTLNVKGRVIINGSTIDLN